MGLWLSRTYMTITNMDTITVGLSAVHVPLKVNRDVLRLAPDEARSLAEAIIQSADQCEVVA